MSVFVATQSEVREGDFASSFFYLKIVWLLGVFCVSIQILKVICSSSVKNALGILIGITLKIASGSIVIFNSINASNPQTQYISPSV